ncbi:hypothetical protein FRC0337_02012 [Corynebacterium diphtheriae]|nr:hypothetical protein CIP107514_02022 [Corynebacterium diphtheriae]CAB0860311.1 hypothetical protein FRC0337_02012 [Corynebacterium diphtheriae]
MFRVIHFSVEALGENGWDAIGVKNAEWFGKFKGFDHQRERESQMAGYTKYLVKSGRWTEQEKLVKKERTLTDRCFRPISPCSEHSSRYGAKQYAEVGAPTSVLKICKKFCSPPLVHSVMGPVTKPRNVNNLGDLLLLS